jgi:GT2 family glycosyltransferase
VGRTYPQPSVFWTRDLAQLTGEIDESMYYCMDYDYFLRMRRHSPSIIYTDDVLSYERDHPHSKGSSQTTLGEIYKNRERHRVYAALKAVRERGESPKMWLRKVLLWRSVSMLSRGRRPRRNFYHGVARKMVNRNIYDLQTDL